MIRTVHVSGFPKSGLTWLTRLLGSALNCPTGATVPELDSIECATEGQYRSGPYVVRKSHFTLSDEVGCAAVPAPHVLAWRNLGPDDRVIFIYRDPRDIVVSGAHYYQISMKEMIYNMVEGAGELATLGPWLAYMNQWLALPFKVTYISYEALTAAPVASVIYMLKDMDLDHEVDIEHIEAAVEYQSFDTTKRRMRDFGQHYNRGQAFNFWFLRRGEVGDWENLFRLSDAVLAYDAWHPMLLRLKYECSPDWWRDGWAANQSLTFADLLKGAQNDPYYRPAETRPFAES